MDDTGFVSGFEGFAIWRAIGIASSSGMAPRLIRCRQILAVDEFHHQHVHAARLFEAAEHWAMCG